MPEVRSNGKVEMETGTRAINLEVCVGLRRGKVVGGMNEAGQEIQK